MLDEVLEAKSLAGDEYFLAKKRVLDGGDPIEKTIELVNFLISDQSNNISGKLISAVWDNYKNDDFLNRLESDPDFCCLRRIDENIYDKVK